MSIETRIVHSEKDMIAMLSKQYNKQIIPGKDYAFKPNDLNTHVVFSQYHWKFCGREIKVVKTTSHFGYDYVSTFAKNGICPLWCKEWLIIPN